MHPFLIVSKEKKECLFFLPFFCFSFSTFCSNQFIHSYGGHWSFNSTSRGKVCAARVGIWSMGMQRRPESWSQEHNPSRCRCPTTSWVGWSHSTTIGQSSMGRRSCTGSGRRLGSPLQSQRWSKRCWRTRVVHLRRCHSTLLQGSFLEMGSSTWREINGLTIERLLIWSWAWNESRFALHLRRAALSLSLL